ncbi:DUF6286 domain-containing protein [Actinoallomurus sp. NBC_01490]|uniref:DUF6286 domain-containing protein n=1 Tax=Actinoallomurus sp. NBC_01490 TaxID=2903557 RepID=UPI002E37CD94|nr:DUF6286 domain-containing protein [Actinoallomurus sp. NBC_01490]
MTGMDAARTGEFRPPSRRAVRRAVRRSFGRRRVLPSVITSALLAAAAIILTIEVIGALVGRPPGVLPVVDLARLGRNLRWDDVLVLAIASVLAALGLWLLLLALRPGRLRAVPLRSQDPNVVLGIARPDLRRYVARAAQNVDGVDRARVKVRRHRVRVRAVSPLHDVAGITGQVRVAVAERLDELEPLHRPHLRVTVRHREE